MVVTNTKSQLVAITGPNSPLIFWEVKISSCFSVNKQLKWALKNVFIGGKKNEDYFFIYVGSLYVNSVVL